MNFKYKILISLTLLISIIVSLFFYQNTTKINNQNKPITPLEYSKLLKVGIDVDWAKTNKGIKLYNKKANTDFKKIGFSHIRLRIKTKAEENFLKHLDKIINDSLENNLIPIIAFQGNNFKEKPSKKTLNEVVKFWEIISKRYQNYSYKISYDILIEVTDKLNKNPKILNELYEKAVSKIREVDKNRIIFISPRVRSSPEYLKDLKIPSNHNNFLMAEFHFYASGPSKTNEKKLWTIGTKFEKNLIINKIKIAKNWSIKNNIYLWVGAWMPSNYNSENNYSLKEQIEFSKFVSLELKKYKIPFAINADSHFYIREKNEFKKEKLELLKTIIN
jgi:hypothetical protein